MSSSLFMRRAAFGARAFSTSTPRSIARISIIGNLADTPEVVPTSTGRELVRYAVASNSGPRDNRQVSWFRVTSFSEGPQKDYLLSLPKGYVDVVSVDHGLR
jgi:single-stranded DNA-binding protein